MTHAAEPQSMTASCPYCGEPTEVWVDPSGGSAQSFVEDCVVCCRPALVVVRMRGKRLTVVLERSG